MSQKSSAPAAREPTAVKPPAERGVRDIRRATRKQHSAEDKTRIVLEGLRGEESIAALCRREGIAESLYYSWSKEFLEAGKRRLAGDTARAATSDEVKALRQEARALKEVAAEQALELRLLKRSMIADGADREGDTPPPRSSRSSAWSRAPTCRCAAPWQAWASRRRRSIAGMTSTAPAAPRRSRTSRPGPTTSGAASPTRCGAASSTWRSPSRSSPRASWRCASPTASATSSPRPRSTACWRRTT